MSSKDRPAAREFHLKMAFWHIRKTPDDRDFDKQMDIALQIASGSASSIQTVISLLLKYCMSDLKPTTL